MTVRENFVQYLERKLWRYNFRNIFVGIVAACGFALLAFWFYSHDAYYAPVLHWLYILLMCGCSLGSLVLSYESFRFSYPKKNPIIADLESGEKISDIRLEEQKIYFITLRFLAFTNHLGQTRKILVSGREQRRNIENGLALFAEHS